MRVGYQVGINLYGHLPYVREHDGTTFSDCKEQVGSCYIPNSGVLLCPSHFVRCKTVEMLRKSTEMQLISMSHRMSSDMSGLELTLAVLRLPHFITGLECCYGN